MRPSALTAALNGKLGLGPNTCFEDCAATDVASTTNINPITGRISRSPHSVGILALAVGPHPHRELTPIPSLGSACPRSGIAACAPSCPTCLTRPIWLARPARKSPDAGGTPGLSLPSPRLLRRLRSDPYHGRSRALAASAPCCRTSA